MSSKIPYLNEVWNPITGCSGKGCATKETCWAREMVNRFPAIHGVQLGIGGSWAKGDLQPERIPFSIPVFHPDRLDQPLHWKKPRRVGVCFMGDLFDEGVRFDYIDRIFQTMLVASKFHIFFLLTKQPQQALKFFQWETQETGEGCSLADNIWLGVSCCTQADVDCMVPDLLRVPGKKWISLEPCMESIKLIIEEPDPKKPCLNCGQKGCDICGNVGYLFNGLDWVVIGCHSNPRRYPCKIEWVESVVEQCKDSGVPVYVKQIEINGKCVRDIERFPKHLQVREMP